MPLDITVQQSPAKQHVGDADSLEIGLLTALGIQAEGEREISELLGRRPRGGFHHHDLPLAPTRSSQL